MADIEVTNIADSPYDEPLNTECLNADKDH